MWLDRLAGQASASGSSTPQSVGRAYSPLPRRTSSNLSPYVTSQRQGHSPRGSSLSLVSTDSSVSLLTSARRPNGSTLKQSFVAAVHPTNSLEALDKLLGRSASAVDSTQQPLTESDLDLDHDFGGLSLKELAASRADDEPQNAASISIVSDDCL